MVKILHIIDKLNGAGPSRSIITAVKWASKLGFNQEHNIIVLNPKAYPLDLVFAKKAGVKKILRNPPHSVIKEEIQKTDIVQINFWNTPKLYEFLRLDLPEMRLVLWLHILGNFPPQVLTKNLIDFADFILPTTPATMSLSVWKSFDESVLSNKTKVIAGIADFSRLDNFQPQSHTSFNVGYIGSLDSTKIHPRYLAMSNKINIPNLQFIICGSDRQKQLQQEAIKLGMEKKLNFLGFVENIKTVLETIDVFGYPLCEETYATSEKSLQEAMYVGIPPVVFPYGGVKHLVEDGKTGLVVNSELEYQKAIEYLYYHPEKRKKLGENAKKFAQENFGESVATSQLNKVYLQAMQKVKYKRKLINNLQKNTLSGAELFLKSLGQEYNYNFFISLSSEDIDTLLEAEKNIAQSSFFLAKAEGGIIHYRNEYPDDNYLRLWSGLILKEEGKFSQAISELKTAIELGLNHWRVNWYIAQTARQMGDFKLAKNYLNKLEKPLSKNT